MSRASLLKTLLLALLLLLLPLAACSDAATEKTYSFSRFAMDTVGEFTLIASSPQAAQAAPPIQQHGVVCTPAGCSLPASSPASAAAGFAAAVFASGALARRRSHSPR